MNITIETAHFYLFEDEKGEPLGFLDEQKVSVQIALQIANELGITPQFLLFVDDYHGHPNLSTDWQTEDIQTSLLNESEVVNAQEYFEQYGIAPRILSELDTTTAAAHLYHLLLHKGVVTKGKRVLYPEFGSTVLLTKDDQPTCSLIDSALYLKKIGPARNQATITVLPIRYKSQQSQVKNILAAFGLTHPPITVMYHDQKGKILEKDDWSQGENHEE